MTEWKEKRDASEFDHNVDGGDYGEWVRVEEAEAKLAAAELGRISDPACAECQEKAEKRIAELETERAALLAEVKRLTAVAAYCQYNCASGRDSESYSLCPDCPAECVNYPGPERPQAAGPAVPVSPEGKYGTVYGLRPMDHKARKHDPISPADPLERA